MMYQTKAKVIKNVEVIKKCYTISLYCPRLAGVAKPGQFLEVQVSDNLEPFLRRPLSIHRVKGTNIELLYEVVGKGTKILSQRRAGEYLDIIGPLGNGFSYALRATPYAVQFLVAGGMGIAPLVFLAETIKRRTPYALGRTQLLIGARAKQQVLCESGLRRLGYEVKIATDDGSRGFKGKVTDLLEAILKRNTTYAIRNTAIYACGPRPMLKTISRISALYNIHAQLSLEEYMACGIGACLGCMVETKAGLKRVCKEGPVFNADEVIW
jgi:dihydroorotate dehydrogenase electron transfer subunit